MTNAPIGVPSGWEEIAAFYFNGMGNKDNNLFLILKDRMVDGTMDLYSNHHHDWRVEE